MRVTDQIVLGISGLLGGMMYPLSVLLGLLRFLAGLTPVTYSLEGTPAAGRCRMARAVALHRGPAAFLRDPDSAVVPGVWLGAAPHQSYRHADAHLSI